MPIDIASGAVSLDYNDVTIPGSVPLAWDRHYSTTLLDQPAGPLGHGWTSSYFVSLARIGNQFVFVAADGSTEVLPDDDGVVAKGGVIRHRGAYLEIFRQANRHVVQRWNVETGAVWRYCFPLAVSETPRRVASIEGITGQRLDVRWDGSERLVSVTQQLEGRQLLLSYNSSGFIDLVLLKNASGKHHTLARYEYDASGRQTAAYDPADFVDRFEYDQNSRLTREHVRDGGVFTYRYDSSGRCVMRAGRNHYNEKRLRYIDGVRITEVTDSCDRTFTYRHTPSGQIVEENDPLGGSRTTDYDEHGRVIRRTDATGSVTCYGFDEQGNRNTVIDALGHTTAFTFNEHHQAVTMTDAAGRLWYREYDSKNQLVSTTDPLRNRWEARYDAEGNLVETINAAGAHKHARYERGMLRATTDWLGHEMQFAVDDFGRVVERRGPLGEVTRIRYDARGYPVQVTRPGGGTTSATYDHAGNLTRFVAPNGAVAQWRYGPCSRLLERIDAVGGTTRYVWGSERGELDEVVNENGETHRFFRDSAGRVIREQSFDGAERLFDYNAEGHAIAYTNGNGETIRYQRDRLHRVVGLQLPDGERISYTFDALGNMSQAISADIAVTFERDPLGRVIRETQGDNWLASRYDRVGDLIRTESSLGHVVEYTLDGNGRVASLSTNNGETIAFERNAYGQETVRSMSGGVRFNRQYDAAGRLIEELAYGPPPTANRASTAATGTEIIRRHYAYEPDGALTQMSDQRWGRTEYIYDPAERLIQAFTKQGTREVFQYDAAGNVLHRSRQGGEPTEQTLTYGPGNRLLRQGNTCYEYDAEGRRTGKIEDSDTDTPRAWTYRWNALNRLKAVVQPDGSVYEYKYDALARRVAKTSSASAGSTPRVFVWDKDVVAHEVENGQASTTWLFDARSNVPVATIQNSRLCSVVTDHIGTPREIISGSGSVMWTRKPAPWGRFETNHASPGDVRCPIAFQGQWLDDESGLSYNTYRYYDPSAMRFISPDPIGIHGGLNSSRYVVNPINWVDPLGLELAKGDPLPPGTEVHRIGGGQPENLQLKPNERTKLDPPGISTLAGGTPQQAANDMRAAFPKGTNIQAASQTTGTASVDAIRAAGFDVIHDPSAKFPNHARIVHPDGPAGFDDPENRKKLSAAFKDTSTCPGAG
jgi:RHS repeat-associated protein